MIWTLNIAHRNASIYIRSRNHILGVGSGRSSWSLDHQLVRGISYHTMHVLLKSLSCPIIFQLACQECCMLVTYVVFTLVWIIRYSPMHCTKTIQRSKVHNSWMWKQLNDGEIFWPTWKGERGPAARQKWLGFCLRDIQVKNVFLVFWSGWSTFEWVVGRKQGYFRRYN